MGVRLLGKTGRLTTGTTLGSAVGTDEENKSKENLTTTGSDVFGGGGDSKDVKSVTQQAAPQTKGSGFTNVQKILKASGTDTGPSRLAQTAAGGVRQAASSAQQALTGAVEKFGKETSESIKAVPTSADIGTIIGKATGTGVGVTAPGLSASDVQKWQQATSGAYAGPTSLQMTPEQQREAAKSSALSRLAGDVSGRSALLQKYVGSPQYGQSKQALDTLLLGRGGSAALRGALRQGARTEQDIKRQEIVAQEQAKQAQEKARGIAEEAKSVLSSKERGVLKQIDETKGSFVESLGAARTRVLNALNAGGRINRSDLNLLGIKPEDLPLVSTPNSRVTQPNQFLTLGEDGKQTVPGFASSAINANKVFLGDLTPQELKMVGLAPKRWSDYSSKYIDEAGITQDEFNIFKSIKTDADLRNFIQNSSPQLVAKYMFSGISPQQVSYDFTQFAPTEESLNTYYNTLGATQFATPEQAAQLTALGRLSGSEYNNLGTAYNQTSTTPTFNISGYQEYINQQNRAFIENDPIYMEAKQVYDDLKSKGLDVSYSWPKELMDKRERQLTSYLFNNPLSVYI